MDLEPAADSAGQDLLSMLASPAKAVSKVASLILQEWSVNSSVVMAVAERTAGMSREDIVDRLEANPELVPLLSRLLHEAGLTGQHKILESLGATFGHGISNPEKAGDIQVILGELGSLKDSDIIVLKVMSEADSVFASQKTPKEIEHEQNPNPKAVHVVAPQVNLTAESSVSAMTRLTGHGFAQKEPGMVWGGDWYKLSDLGLLLCGALTELSLSPS